MVGSLKVKVVVLKPVITKRQLPGFVPNQTQVDSVLVEHYADEMGRGVRD